MGFPVEEAHRFAEEIGSREDTFNSMIQSIDIDKAGTSVAYDKEMIISELEKHNRRNTKHNRTLEYNTDGSFLP